MRKTNAFLKVVASLLFVLSISMIGYAQTKNIGGKVIDESGEMLPGVSIIIKGTTNGTVTNIDGEYSISGVETSSILVFSFIGMETQEITVGNQTSINVTLESQSIGLEEAIVVGYGTQKKVNLTGSVEMVSAEKLENKPVANVGQALQGLIANLHVDISSGDPTNNPEMTIRGFESINGGDPLVLVDGVPMELNSINPLDIASISVLKDAGAAAIYGARGAFGVILVETKKGKDKVKVRFNAEMGLDKPIDNLEIVENGYEYAMARNAAEVRNGNNPYYTDEYIAALKNYWDDPDNNPGWEIVNDGTNISIKNYQNHHIKDDLLNAYSPRQKYDVSVSGATEKMNFYTSFSHINIDGYLNHPANDNFKRYNVLMKGEFKVNDYVSINQQITINAKKSDKPNASINSDLVRTPPLRFYHFPLIEGYEQYEGEYVNHAFNAYAKLDEEGRKTWQDVDTWLKSAIKITPTDRLSLNADFSYQFYNRTREDYEFAYQMKNTNLSSQDIYSWSNTEDIITAQKIFNRYYVFNAYADYEIDDVDNIYFKALLGFNQEYGIRDNILVQNKGFYHHSVINVDATRGDRTGTGGASENSLRGAFYRMNFIYKDRYLVEMNGRYDGTSRFPKEDRFGFFPSFSVGWRISEEPFMESTRDFLDNLKLRASYGTLGNQTINDWGKTSADYYPYIPSMPTGESIFLMNGSKTPWVGSPGLVSNSLTWETIVSKNLALDVSLFGSRLNASFDIYTRETKDMLMKKTYPSILGASSPSENAANLMTKGWEFTANWRDKITGDLSYNVDLSLADWTSEITKYDNPSGAIGSNQYYVGQQINEIWGYETVGIIQDEEQLANLPDQSYIGTGYKVGDIEYANLDDDPKITPGSNTLDDPGDRRVIGNSTPRYQFGVNAGIKYKNLSLNLFFQGVGKRDFYPSTSGWQWFWPGKAEGLSQTAIDESWTPENPDAYFPELQMGGISKNFTTQTRYLQNAAYVRLKSISLNYRLPSSWVQKIGLGSVSVYGSALNLWEFSKIHKPLDPEYLKNSTMAYPLFRTYTTGIIVEF